ncbi:hypothetical protein KEM48_000405 [Puccinia striiformis f. sp. tritici PST-130]|nr:hypothetical protein KEM48_000405 [Puccinia striiformis f. sp. tritici PST-130]
MKIVGQSFAGIDLRQVVHTAMKPEYVMGPDLIDDWAKIGNKLFDGNGVIPSVRGIFFVTPSSIGQPHHILLPWTQLRSN